MPDLLCFLGRPVIKTANKLVSPMNIKNQSQSADQETQDNLVELCGQVARVTYSEAESGFAVVQLQVPGESELVTAVGNLMTAASGIAFRLKGQWTEHPRYGKQFRVHWAYPDIPTTQRGVESYLGSGLIRGIGPTLAKRIVSRFGKKAIDILDQEIHRLLEVKGIGRSKLKEIKKSWIDHKQIHDVMLFLQSHGVSPSLANKIFNNYGHHTIALVRENPFQMADDIVGIGFLTADRIASQLGLAPHNPQRIQAGILHVLKQLSEEGHLFYPFGELTAKSRTILNCDDGLIATALERLQEIKKIVIQQLTIQGTDNAAPLQVVYLTPHYIYETFIAKVLGRLVRAPQKRPHIDTAKALTWIQNQFKMQLARRQTRAISMALQQNVLVITGGPGTGKTTIIRAITRLFERLGARIMLAAPTGRAAKRMSETSGRAAKTIHRLLEYSPAQGEFQRNDSHPLDCQLLIVDEVSMVDAPLMYYLLKAVPPDATLILVGDNHQLPSVGPGNVLQDIIASQVIPVVTLREIFRQDAAGRIIINAHRINTGQVPLLDPPRNSESDFYFIAQHDPNKILDLVLKITSQRIPRRFGLDPVDDIQVLTPMHKGILGAGNLNNELQQLLNPNDVYLKRGDKYFRLNDKVMQIRNNYTKEVFNGDIGRIVAIDTRSVALTVRFDDRRVRYDPTDLDDIVLAYAISVHKSQGSEYTAVVIPVTTQHYVMLQRNLLYTAVTRGKQLVVLVGDRRALAIAVKNNKPQLRYTHLAQRLASKVGGSGPR